MMEIKLKSLKLENFKGIKEFTFTPDGKDATIRGDNATGKTTIADGFRYLLFGKDTQDSANFAIKTLDEAGEYIPNLDHTVKAVISIDGTAIELMKVYKETWTKKRGSAMRTLTGHTTDHFIDGVPVQKNKWDGRLGDLINEDVFKLITLPSFFNSMHWQKRREILLQVCGTVADEQVISSDSELGALPEILGDRSLEDAKKVISAEKKKINDRLKEIPARIDELTKTLPPKQLNRKAIEAMIKLIDNQIEKAKDDTELSGLRKELAEAQTKLAEAQAKQAQDIQNANAGIDAKVFEAQAEIRKRKWRVEEIWARIDGCGDKIKRNTETMAKLRANFTAVQAREQFYKEICICPTCNDKHTIPKDQVDAAKSRFNENQAAELASIQVDGKKLKAANETLKETTAGDEKKIKSLEIEIAAWKKTIEEAEKERVEVIPTDHTLLKMEITKFQEAIKDRPATDTSALEAERREEQGKLGALDAAEKTQARIKELGEEEKALAAKFEELEAQLFLMEKFIVAKVGLLESKINDKFQLARFKLFDVQINEGIKECCVTTVGGVPYGSGLNKGMEINAGIDIIRTLSEHYNIKAPLWLDNAEAVTEPLEIDSQTFKLVVSKDHPEMKVSYANNANMV